MYELRSLRCICLVFSIHGFGVSSRLWRYMAQADGMVPEVSDITGSVAVVSCLLFHCAYVIGSRQVQKVCIHHLGGCSEATRFRLTWHQKSIQRSNTYVPFVGYNFYHIDVNGESFPRLNIEALTHCGRACEDKMLKSRSSNSLKPPSSPQATQVKHHARIPVRSQGYSACPPR
ncbi:hypothetical protein CC79DRAFT_440055 [Sarocladium strictum]